MKEKVIKKSELKFLRIDPFYEMNIRAIDISHFGNPHEIDVDSQPTFYELEDYLMTYSFLAKMGEDIVGFCLLTILPDQYGFKRALVVDQLKVAKNYENKGLAQAMYQQIKKVVRNTESEGVVFHCHARTPAVEHLIKKWNFEPINTLLYKSKSLA